MTVTPWLTEILVFCKLRCSRRVTLPVRGLAQPAPHNPPRLKSCPWVTKIHQGVERLVGSHRPRLLSNNTRRSMIPVKRN